MLAFYGIEATDDASRAQGKPRVGENPVPKQGGLLLRHRTSLLECFGGCHVVRRVGSLHVRCFYSPHIIIYPPVLTRIFWKSSSPLEVAVARAFGLLESG